MAWITLEEVEMKWALLVIDVQKAFLELDPTTTRSLQDAIECINEGIALFRKKGLPVICVQHRNDRDNLVPGEKGYEVPDELHIEPADLHISKVHGSAFAGTSLEGELRAMGVDRLVITGFCAEYCVLSTYKAAEDLDFLPVILRGAIASGHPPRIRFVEEICDLVSDRALESFLD